MRRALLVVACSVVPLTLATQPKAGDTAVEAAGYEGHSTGHWTCGPQGSVRYGGLGAQVRHSERAADGAQGLGATVVVSGAVEGAHVHFTEEQEDAARPSADTGVFGGAGFRLGHHWQYVGFELGALVWSGWSSPGQTGRGGFPQAELSLGRRDVFYGVVGVGAPTVTWITRPAIPYAGLGWHCPVGCRLELRAGKFRSGPGVLADRDGIVDLSWYVPMRRALDLRASLAFGDELTAERQASVGLAFKLD